VCDKIIVLLVLFFAGKGLLFCVKKLVFFEQMMKEFFGCFLFAFPMFFEL